MNEECEECMEKQLVQWIDYMAMVSGEKYMHEADRMNQDPEYAIPEEMHAHFLSVLEEALSQCV